MQNEKLRNPQPYTFFILHLSFCIFYSIEAPEGFEPTHKGFADLSLTTWVRRQHNGEGCLLLRPTGDEGNLLPAQKKSPATWWDWGRRGNVQEEVYSDPFPRIKATLPDH